MEVKKKHVVTGAFGYSGKYIAKRLLQAGHEVHTLTNSINRASELQGQIEVFPFHFADPDRLRESLQGAEVLYNTYWVRFNHKDFQHASAVENTLKLFKAAKDSGVERIVHVSITNPSLDSNLEYFSGKAKLEQALIESGLSYAILRPTVLFGKEDILVNNIAWMLRNFPIFAVFGDGKYRLQPIYVDDLAKLAVEQGKERESRIINAIGPETFTYREMVVQIGKIIGKQRLIVSLPDAACYFVANMVGKIVGDVIVTKEEIEGLKADLLYVDSPPAGQTKLTEWIKENVPTLGVKYANELARRKNRLESY